MLSLRPGQGSLLFFISTIACGFALSMENASASSSWAPPPSWVRPTNVSKEKIKKDAAREVSPFSPGSHNFALDLGQVFLMGNLADSYQSSIGTQFSYSYGVSDIFAFDASFGFSDHATNTVESAFGMKTLLAGMRTNLNWYDKVVPSIRGGMGFFNPTYKLTPTSSLSTVLFGLYLGPAVDLQITNQMFFGTSLNFYNMFSATKAISTGTKEVGGTFMSFLLHVGFSF
jgi:hypothetical protein